MKKCLFLSTVPKEVLIQELIGGWQFNSREHLTVFYKEINKEQVLTDVKPEHKIIFKSIGGRF